MSISTHQYFSLRWNNYQNTMTSVFQQLREDQSFVDVTLSCENGSLKAHKVVLSACSTYFQKLLLENPCKHPTIILPSEIIYNDLKTIIDFVYRGEIDVSESELQGLLRTAEQLKIKGLCETTESSDETIIDTGATPATITEPADLQQSQISQISEIVTSGNNVNQQLTAVIAAQQRKSSRIRKRSKSPSISGVDLNTIQTNFNSSSVVNLNSAAVQQLVSNSSNASGSNNINLHHIKSEQILSNSDTADGDGDHSISDAGGCSPLKQAKLSKTDNSSDNVSVVSTSSATAGNSSGTQLVAQIVVSREKDKNMTSLGMGMNGGLLGVPMGFLDFAPEPPAPSATPVTEHVDMSCAPSNDTRDLSNSTPTNGDEVRIKFETLRSLDPTETLDIDNHIATHIIQRLDQSPMHQIQHHVSGVTHDSSSDGSNQNLMQTIKTDIIDKHHQHQHHQIVTTQSTTTQMHQQHQQQQQQQQQHIQQQLGHSQTHLQHQQQEIQTTAAMEIDPSNIKHEPAMIITPEIVTMMSTGNMDIYSDTSEDSLMIANGSPNENNEPQYTNLDQQQDMKLNGPKTWTQEDMNSALDALKNHNMSLTKASVTYGIPSTTLWQRAHRLGIDTPKKEGTTKSWNEDALNNALEALRTGSISANKASKAYGIPSSTLYKIARREGIRLAAPFNAAPTTWTSEDLERALEAIRAGHTSVQKASTEFGIPTGTLYGRCKREGIELSRSNPTPWSEDAMNEALVAVRVGHMSINQAAIHYNLPYSSLYGRFKRGKFETTGTNITISGGGSGNNSATIELLDHSPENSFQYAPTHVSTPNQQQQQQHHQQASQQQQQHHIQVQHQQIQQHHHSQQQQQQQQQHHLQQQQDVTTSNQVQIVHSQGGQIQQIYHHHSTPERS